jgi:hypothetical protein
LLKSGPAGNLYLLDEITLALGGRGLEEQLLLLQLKTNMSA